MFLELSSRRILQKLKTYYVYILASGKNGTLYIGVINNLLARVKQHKEKFMKGFTEKYKVDELVYYEDTSYVTIAIQRETQMKAWKREWKIRLINKANPEWKDLY